MANFDKGSDIGASDGLAQVDSIAPSAIVASQALAVFNDMVSFADCTSGNIVLDLPAASSSPNAVFTIKRTDASGNTITIDADGADTIDGSGTFLLSSQNDSIKIFSDGVSKWQIISTSSPTTERSDTFTGEVAPLGVDTVLSFALSFTPLNPAGVQVHVNGLRLPGSWFSIGGTGDKKVTFLALTEAAIFYAITTADDVIVDYMSA